ncbi:MAG: hypothetical protein V2I36_15350 [Desulfopila sp.]|jgi:general secretion pathway protein M|nr:hypothetical protein [Desulfopila sp.]
MLGKYIKDIREKSGFDKLESREKLIVLIGLCFLVIFALVQFVVMPYLDADSRLDSSISQKEAELVELQLLQQDYRSLRAEAGGIREQLQKRPSSFSLFSFLDEQASVADVKEFIGYMKPSTFEGDGELVESLVEMKLQGIALEKLVAFLERIESPENVVSIKRISIQESGQEKGLLEVILQIVTFVDNG